MDGLDPPLDLDWENLGFKYSRVPHLVVSRWTEENPEWSTPKAEDYAELQLEPSTGILNYGQGYFEGMKAFRHEDGSVHVYRPTAHAERAQRSSRRLCMPEIPVETFIKAVKMAAALNSAYVPPKGTGRALYLRPLVFADEAYLSVRSAKSFKLCVYCSPVGPFFKRPDGIKLLATREYHRSFPKGVGRSKVPGNYCATTYPRSFAYKDGYNELLFLDGGTDELVEECSGSNFFALIDGVIRTPSVHRNTFLDGITRDSVIYLARNRLGMTVIDDEDLPVAMLQGTEQAFCTGTAWIVESVQSITVDKELTIVCKSIDLGRKFISLLTDIQCGDSPAPDGWLVRVTADDKP